MQVCLIKLGGSLITDKSQANKSQANKSQANLLRHDKIVQVAQELADILQAKPHLRIVLANGNGSVGHPIAQTHGITSGFDGKNALGFCLLQKTVASLNRTVVEALLAHRLPAMSVQPSALFWREGGAFHHHDLSIITDLLDKQIIPVLYGDPIPDRDQGFNVISSDTLLTQLARYLISHPSYEVGKVISLGHYDGVLDDQGNVIPEINQVNYGSLKHHITGSAHVDISGGMAYKVQDLLALAQWGCPSWIINGSAHHNLKNLVLHNQSSGTTIR